MKKRKARPVVVKTNPGDVPTLISMVESMQVVREAGIQISLPTLIAWVQSTGIGFQVVRGGRWYVDKPGLTALVRPKIMMRGGRPNANRNAGVA